MCLQSSKCWQFLKIFTYEKHLYLLQHMSVRTVWLVLSQLLFLLLIVYTKTSRKVSASPGLLKSDYRVCIPANTLMTRRQENSQENMVFLDSYGGETDSVCFCSIVERNL